jgi:hypothetical protein
MLSGSDRYIVSTGFKDGCHIYVNVLISAVCYNNFRDAHLFVIELAKSLGSSVGTCVQLKLVNNGDDFPSHIKEQILAYCCADNLKIEFLEGHGNVGYFPGAALGLAHSATLKIFSVLIVCNLDLHFEKDFFEQLNSKMSSDPLILAPAIYSVSENKQRNPKIMKRYSLFKMCIFVGLYLVPWLHLIYRKTLYSQKPLKVAEPGESIYAAHGSCICFVGGNEFWKEFLSYPRMLFGEEIFVAEIASSRGIETRYRPELRVIDRDHGSTGKKNEKFLRLCNLNSIWFLIKKFYLKGTRI